MTDIIYDNPEEQHIIIEDEEQEIGEIPSTSNVPYDPSRDIDKGTMRTIKGLRSVSYEAERDGGNAGSTMTIDWNHANHQVITLTDNTTLVFIAPPGPASLTLKLIQDGTGSRNPVWPATVKWAGGTEPTWSTGAGEIDLVKIYHDGTNYNSEAILDLS